MVGATYAVTVIVGDVGEDLQGEGGQQRENEDEGMPGTVVVGERVAATDDSKGERQGARAGQLDEWAHVIFLRFINL